MEKRKKITVVFQLRKPKVPKGHFIEYILHVKWSLTGMEKAGNTPNLMHIIYSRPSLQQLMPLRVLRGTAVQLHQFLHIMQVISNSNVILSS